MSITADFWATTAQVIPTLLLAYAVEREFTKPSDSAPRSVASLFVAFIVGLALMGEFLALRGLLSEGGVWSARIVVLAIGMLCWLIVGSFLIGYASENLPKTPEIETHPLRSAFLGSAGMVAALLVAFLPLAAAIWVAAGIAPHVACRQDQSLAPPASFAGAGPLNRSSSTGLCVEV